MSDLNIFMAFHNNEKTIEKSIKSILQQSYKDFKLILVDDASSDRSQEIAKKIKDKDERVNLIINSKQIGLASSLNNAIKKYPSSFIGRMDADDFSLPNRLKYQIRFLKKFKKISVLGTNIYTNYESKYNILCLSNKHNEIRKNVYKMMPFAHPTIIMRIEAFKKVGGYKDLKKSQDLDLFYRMLNKNILFHNLKLPLLIYKTSNKSVLKILNSLKIKFLYELKLKNYLGCILNIFFSTYEVIKLVLKLIIFPNDKSTSSKY